MKKTRTLVRWGIVGLGGVVVGRIAPALSSCPGSRLLACTGHTAEKTDAFAKQFGVERVYHGYHDLINDPDVEAVYIATPNALHVENAIAAARAGKHILCEKPLALSVEDGRQIVDACREAGVVIRVAFQFRFEEMLQRIREIILSGALGELRCMVIKGSAPVGPRGAWRKDPIQGGILFDMAVHFLDLLPWISGLDFVEIFASSHPDRRGGEADDTVTILGTLGDGCHAVMRASREIAFGENGLVIEGTNGMLATCGYRRAAEYILRITNASGTVEERFAPTPTYKREIEAFEREVRGEASVLPTGEHGVRIVQLASAVLQSIQTRRSIGV